MRAVILAGGKGKRLAPYTAVFPKPLMPIGDIPILEIVIRQLAHYGFKKITLAVGYQAGLIETFFGNGKKLGVKIDYSRESEPLGTAGPLSLIKDLDDTFLLMNGDILTDLKFNEMIRFHQKHIAFATLGLFTKKVQIDLGVVDIDKQGHIKDYIEKPELEYSVSTGIYVFEPKVLRYIPRGERLDLPDLIKLLIKEGRKVVAYKFNGYWLDIGRYEDYQEASRIFERRKNKFLY